MVRAEPRANSKPQTSRRHPQKVEPELLRFCRVAAEESQGLQSHGLAVGPRPQVRARSKDSTQGSPHMLKYLPAYLKGTFAHTCMNLYIHIYLLHIRICCYTCPHIYIYTTHIHMYYIYTYIHIYINVYIYRYIYVYICIFYTYTCIHIHICTYVHKHI